MLLRRTFSGNDVLRNPPGFLVPGGCPFRIIISTPPSRPRASGFGGNEQLSGRDVRFRISRGWWDSAHEQNEVADDLVFHNIDGSEHDATLCLFRASPRGTGEHSILRRESFIAVNFVLSGTIQKTTSRPPRWHSVRCPRRLG